LQDANLDDGKNSFAPLLPPVLSSGGRATGLRTARRRARIDDVEDELTAAVLVLALSMLQQPEGNDPGRWLLDGAAPRLWCG
jgi:hypothetical protein